MADAAEVASLKAVINKLQQFADIPVSRMQMPNVGFTPPDTNSGNMWLRVNHIPNDSFSLGLSRSSSNQHYGIVQIDVMADPGVGEYAPGRMASSLIEHFEVYTNLESDGFRVQIYRLPSRGTLLKDGAWVFIPVSVSYRCFAPNPA